MQGFGNVGAWAADIFHENGGKVIAASDAFGAIRNDQGLDVPALRRHLASGAKLSEFTGGSQSEASACSFQSTAAQSDVQQYLVLCFGHGELKGTMATFYTVFCSMHEHVYLSYYFNRYVSVFHNLMAGCAN